MNQKNTAKAFKNIKDKETLVKALNSVAFDLYNNKSAFSLKHINYYSLPGLATKRYSSFKVLKKSGKSRTIHIPCKSLMSILDCLSIIFNSYYKPQSFVTGFVCGKSIVDNASIHLHKDYVYNIDLKDFFYSFDRNRVKMGIWKTVFNMEKDKENVSFILACLTTHPIEIQKGVVSTVLPQGSPSSPVLSNILCIDLDRRLNGLAKRFKLKYSRYADDITFSSNKDVFSNEDFQKELLRIIEVDQKLFINPSKTRLQDKSTRQEVTGLVINEKVNVSKRYIKQLRMWIYFIEKYGLEKAQGLFIKDYIKEKGHVKSHKASIKNVIIGKLQYLKMVKGDKDPTYLKLFKRAENIFPIDNKLEQILSVWQTKGIQEAMKLYEF